jgi:glycerol-3-phosphate dehydrogenase
VADGCAVIKAEVQHAVTREHAQKLSDVVLRRTELGSASRPSEPALKTCAKIMAKELQWNRARITEEIDEVVEIYNPV